MTEEVIKPTQKALNEALVLAEEAIKAIELNETSLTNIALKASRIARLINDFEYQQIMQYEAGGYPTTPGGMSPEAWRLALIANRKYQIKTGPTTKDYAYLESIEVLEQQVSVAQVALQTAKDPDISIASANPNQYLFTPGGNGVERTTLRQSITTSLTRLSQRRAFIHSYLQRKYYEIKFSGLAEDIFSRIKIKADSLIGEKLPQSVQKLTAIYDHLTSDNPEDWAGAVHSCRRLLQELADTIFPPTKEKRFADIEGKKQEIKLGADNYVNRIIAYIEDHSKSTTTNTLIGSHIKYIGERLDSVFQASQKGSHSTITHEEADRYVVFTYLLVADILSI